MGLSKAKVRFSGDCRKTSFGSFGVVFGQKLQPFGKKKQKIVYNLEQFVHKNASFKKFHKKRLAVHEAGRLRSIALVQGQLKNALTFMKSKIEANPLASSTFALTVAYEKHLNLSNSTNKIKMKGALLKLGEAFKKAKIFQEYLAQKPDAQKTIAQLGIEEVRLNALKDKQSKEKEKIVRTPSLEQAVAPQKPDPKAEAWAESNEWFGKDSAMTYTAFDYHKKLTEQEGYDPNSDEYYAEIDKRMRLDFPHKFGNTKSQESTKPTQTVASATRSVKPSRNTVRLTSSQVAIAKKLNVPLEEYAKQLKITKEV